MKRITLLILLSFFGIQTQATIHIIRVWDGYFQYLPSSLTIQLGDTIQWLPLDQPIMVHTITSTNIPVGAATFDQIWQAPADTFFQYIPTIAGVYDYVCTPHAVSFGMTGQFTVQGTTAIAEDGIGESESPIFPNPVGQTLHWKESAATSEFQIFGMNGQLLMAGSSASALDVSGLAKGSYLLEILGDERRVCRFLKD